jgi:hypothetical protein
VVLADSAERYNNHKGGQTVKTPNLLMTLRLKVRPGQREYSTVRELNITVFFIRISILQIHPRK